MVRISAFKSLRPVQKLVAKVTTQPYSNYSQDQIEKELKDNEYSFLNIIAKNQTKNLEIKFQHVKNKIDEFKKNQILEKEQENSIYVYRKTENNKIYTGLICAIDVKDYKNGKIKIHEKTIKKRELLFAKYLTNTKIHAEPVLLTYDNNIEFVTEGLMSPEKKLYNFRDQQNTIHEIWRIRNTQEIKQLINNFKKIKNLYIADGHHRMASSMRENEKSKCLAYILPKNQLKTYPFHRIVTVNKKIIKEIKTKLKIEEIHVPQKKSNMIQLYMDKKWHQIKEQKKEKDIAKSIYINNFTY